MPDEQVDIWEAIDEAEGFVPRTVEEIVVLLTALEPDDEALFRRSEWANLMIARRRVVADTGRFFTAARADVDTVVRLAPRNVNAPDLKPGDVLWTSGATVVQVHRRDGKVRLVTSIDPVVDWGLNWAGTAEQRQVVEPWMPSNQIVKVRARPRTPRKTS
jgi:hypothetical protein